MTAESTEMQVCDVWYHFSAHLDFAASAFSGGLGKVQGLLGMPESQKLVPAVTVEEADRLDHQRYPFG